MPIAMLANRLHHGMAFAQKKVTIVACFSGDRKVQVTGRKFVQSLQLVISAVHEGFSHSFQNIRHFNKCLQLG